MTYLGRSTRIFTATLLAAAMAVPATAPPANAAPQGAPSRINLPDGFRPEGIAIGRQPVAFTGSWPTATSIAPTCAPATGA